MSSYNPTSHKATTIRTLTRRAQLVCDSTDSLTDESKYLDNVFSKNNYNPDFVKRNVYKNNEPNTTNAKPVTTATIPYIKGTSETIARILQPYNIRVAHKPITTLRQLLTNVKYKDEPNDRQGAVYKINCCDCQASYIGETGRNLNIRLTEHKRATKNGDVNNHIAEHHLHTNHRIDRMTEFKTYKGADTRCNFSCSVARDRISFFGGGEGGVSHDAICCGQLRKSRTRFYFCNCCAQRCKKNLSYTGPLEQLLIAEIAKASLLFSNYVY